MKFFGQNQSTAKPNRSELNDYFDLQSIEALTPAHRHLIFKLLNSESGHIDKFLNKVALNQIQVNHDMFSKIATTLKHQMSLPIQVIHQNLNISFDYLSNYDLAVGQEFETWQNLQQQLRIWGHFDFETIMHYLKISYNLIKHDICPQIDISPPPRFWKNKTPQNAILVLFNFIYEKFKYFHAELLPHSKRPMDLFELLCPLEDAALEQKLIFYNDQQLEFLRSLNASALVLTVIQSFKLAIPDLMAAQIQESQNIAKTDAWQNFFKCSGYQPIYGNHPYLQEVGYQAWFEGLEYIIHHLNLPEPQLHDLFSQANSQDPFFQNIQTMLQNHSHRLIFIFNRMTSLGFLLRSPLFKGMGYQPLIHTEAPLRLNENFLSFVNYYQNQDLNTKASLISHFYDKPHQPSLKMD
jgi:hypothetical protein